MDSKHKSLVIRILTFGVLVPLGLVIVALDILGSPSGSDSQARLTEMIMPLGIVAFGLILLIQALKSSESANKK